MAMKPIPKAILIVLLVAAAGGAIDVVLTKMPPKAVTVEPTVAPAPVVRAAPAEMTIPPVPAQNDPVLRDASADRGLDKLLQQGKR
jgi:hypothetical protein